MIVTEQEPKEMVRTWPAENSCMCRKPTRLWTVLPDRTPGQQVATCECCATVTEPQNVPSKQDWMARERLASGWK